MSDHRFRKKVNGIRIPVRVKNNLYADRHRNGPKLSMDDANYILAHTGMTEKQLRKQFKEFVKDCPNGLLEKNRVMNMLMNILPEETVKILADQIFNLYDEEKTGSINFTNFILATHFLADSSIESKLQHVFQLCDTDRSDRIQLRELVGLFGTLYMNEGVDKNLAVERSYHIFNTLDTTNDGFVTREEFIEGCLQDKDLVNNLK